MPSDKPYAEIIESSLQTFIGQCWQWDQMPSFGSLVIVESDLRPIFGIVHDIKTGSMDSSRYPFPYQKTHEELRAEQPQIFEFLKTTFSCISMGYQEKGKLYYIMPPEPPKIHSFIQNAENELFLDFLAKKSYLPLLFAHAGALPLDELFLALLKHRHSLIKLKSESVHAFLDTYSLLIGHDYRRLKLFGQRLQSIIDN